tara:strand:- start:749 stop:1213 length:465 start_codon:yes stop_codon:yes gene_type:complete
MSDREIMNAKYGSRDIGKVVKEYTKGRVPFTKDEFQPAAPPTGTNDIDELRRAYPDIHQAYERISNEQFNLFARKMLDYGKSNISVGTNLDTEAEVHVSLTGIWFRMNDKINRLKQLVLLNKDARVKSESVKDTFQDLSIYGIIAQIVSNGNWK